jgi:hypothetical protein
MKLKEEDPVDIDKEMKNYLQMMNWGWVNENYR